MDAAAKTPTHSVARTHDLAGLVRVSSAFTVVACDHHLRGRSRRTGACCGVLGIAPTQSLPIRDALIGSLSAMFALMVAFSAAGSWSDAVQARAAVQREANSIENIIAIAWSFPNEFRDQVHNEILRYARRVVEKDWPAMRHRAEVLSWL